MISISLDDSIRRIKYVVDDFDMSRAGGKREDYTKRFLIERIYKICNVKLKTPEPRIVSKYGTWADYELENFNESFLLEAKSFGDKKGIEKDVKELRNALSHKQNKWSLGVATDGITWVFIKQGCKEKLDIKKDTEKIILLLSGKRELPEFSKKIVTKEFYNMYKGQLDTLVKGVTKIQKDERIVKKHSKKQPSILEKVEKKLMKDEYITGKEAEEYIKEVTKEHPKKPKKKSPVKKSTSKKGKPTAKRNSTSKKKKSSKSKKIIPKKEHPILKKVEKKLIENKPITDKEVEKYIEEVTKEPKKIPKKSVKKSVVKKIKRKPVSKKKRLSNSIIKTKDGKFMFDL